MYTDNDRYFGNDALVNKTINSILGYMPTVAHWGWNGNARRYWDNMYVSNRSLNIQ